MRSNDTLARSSGIRTLAEKFAEKFGGVSFESNANDQDQAQFGADGPRGTREELLVEADRFFLRDFFAFCEEVLSEAER